MFKPPWTWNVSTTVGNELTDSQLIDRIEHQVVLSGPAEIVREIGALSFARQSWLHLVMASPLSLFDRASFKVVDGRQSRLLVANVGGRRVFLLSCAGIVLSALIPPPLEVGLRPLAPVIVAGIFIFRLVWDLGRTKGLLHRLAYHKDTA